jgi:hypothetical protein
MTERDIEAVISVSTPPRPRSAVGLRVPMILVTAGNGWFLHQFLSPSLNTRRTNGAGPGLKQGAAHGGDLPGHSENNRGGNPDRVRISGSECFDGGYGI